MIDHQQYMHRCLELASLGLGRVQPNPMVGAVLVVDGKIIGEGWHRRYGHAHAEVDALASVQNPELLRKATMYVNLEPCSHFGKTPPCADAIIAAQIPKVVIANVDSNEKVNGTGIQKLKEAGIEVITGILENEGYELNKRFFTYHAKKRPYIILKWAQTQDGFMDILRLPNRAVEPYWITNTQLRTIVHKWRSEEDAILIGYNTLVNDKPQLNTRLFPGKSPRRFVMKHSDQENTFCDGFDILPNHPEEALKILYQQKIQSIIIEGGYKTLSLFIESGLWDEARILIGNQCWGDGAPAPCLHKEPDKEIDVLHNKIQYVRRHL